MRPRERYTHTGPDTFGDAELLSLILGTGAAGRSAIELAAALIDRFGGLGPIAHATVHALAESPGVGPARAVRVHAALQAGRRSLRTPTEPQATVCSPDDAYALLGPPLRGLLDEELHALYLDRRRRPMLHRRLTRGSDAYTVVDPRQIFRVAVSGGASAVVLAHNHPSGDPSPSSQDAEVTRRVAEAGRVLGVPLLDHLVIGHQSFTSMAEEGRLPQWVPGGPVWTA